MAQETDLINAAAAELRKRGLAGTPERVERVANAARGKRPTVAEAVAAVNALVEKSKVAEPERTVVAMCLAPRNPDGSGGAVEKVIRVGPKPRREYAAQKPHFVTDETTSPGTPTGEDELARLQAKRKAVQAIIDDPATSDLERVKARGELIKITEEIAAFETALHPVPQAGKSPTVGAKQFAPPVPYWERGAELNATRRAQLEAEAAGLAGQLAAGTLTPAETIRTEQALKTVRAILAEARPDDWQLGQR